MANKNIKALISVPNRGIGVPLELNNFIAKDAGGYIRIPRRFPMADVVAPAGYFRHNIIQNASGQQTPATDVSSEIGGVAGAGALSTLGFELPPTEKLILLVKKGTAENTAATIVVKGSVEYKQADVTITLPAAAVLGTLFEIDLTAFGLFIGRKGGLTHLEDGIILTPGDTTTSMVLLVRAA
jgi:hypothetical protein